MQLHGFVSCYRLLNPRHQREYWIVALLASVGALMEMVGLAAIIPVVTVLVDYEGTVSRGHLARVFEFLGHPNQHTFLIVLAAAAIGAVWFSGIVGVLSTFASQRYLKRINADVSARVYQEYMDHPIEKFYGRASSEFLRNVNGISDRVTTGVIGASIIAIARTTQILIVAMVLFLVNFKVTVTILAVIGGSYAVIFLTFKRRIARMATENVEESRTLQQLIIGSYQAYRSIVIDQQLRSLVQHFTQLKSATSRRAADIEIIGSTPRRLIEVIGITLLILASYIVGRSAVDSQQFVAVMALFAIAAYRLLPSAQQLYNALNQMISALAAYRVVATGWAGLKPATPPHQVPVSSHDKPRVLEARGVSYGFGKKRLFENFSTTINLDGITRITGDSGVGKTTFIEILAGLRQPQTGQVFLDGAHLIEGMRPRWWSRISYVSQTDYVYEGSLGYNVILDRPADPSRLALVADVCGLHTLCPGGLFDPDQDVSEAGVNLSGGQRSRIVLARALYKHSDVIFLDEAFAALDVDSAATILSRIRFEFPHRCLFVISHRENELPQPFRTISLSADDRDVVNPHINTC